jgi:hypothetical protein
MHSGLPEHGPGAIYTRPILSTKKMVKGFQFMMEVIGIDCDIVTYDSIPKCNKFVSATRLIPRTEFSTLVVFDRR